MTIKKGKKMGASMLRKKGAALGGLEDDEAEDSNFDQFLTDYEKQKKEQEDSQMTEIKLHELEKTKLENEIKALIKQKDTDS